MYRTEITLGIMPTKRGFLSMEEAHRQKKMFMEVVAEVTPPAVKIVDVDDICENGIAWEFGKVSEIVEKFKAAGVDALFTPFCDFGEESVVSSVSAGLRVPHLVWGARDEVPNTDAIRGRDTQCGMFAATKVLRRFGIKYSYIYNVPAQSEEFKEGYMNFLRTVAVLKDLNGLRIAKIGDRPGPFMSVMTNEAALMKKFGIVTVPISPSSIEREAVKILADEAAEFKDYLDDFLSRFDVSAMDMDKVKKIAAVKLALRNLLSAEGCNIAAIECWPGCVNTLGVPVCTAMGELADEGMPISCETDINGAITMAILRASALGEEAPFLADLTIRHPENDNAELLWHCGPFPYSLKDEKSRARLIDGQERFELKQGDITLCRFDDIDGEYYLFAGEGKSTTGPETTGTYVWFEADDWKKWEEKFIFGPYIHHVGGTYGKLKTVLKEVARYLDINFDSPDTPGPGSL